MTFRQRLALIATALAYVACASAVLPPRPAADDVAITAPTTITVSYFTLPLGRVVGIVRSVYDEDRIPLPDQVIGDTLLESLPIQRDSFAVVHRVRIRPSDRTLVSIDAVYRLPSDSAWYFVTQDSRGTLGRVWNTQLRLARKLYERREGY